MKCSECGITFTGKHKCEGRDNLLDVIRAIEKIVSDDQCGDWEWDLFKERFKTDTEKAMAEKIGKIYTLAHAHSRTCGNPHEGWRLKK